MGVSRFLAAAALCGLAVAPLHAQTFNVSFDGTEPSGIDRLFRDGVPSSAGTLKAFPGTFSNVSTFFDVFQISINPGSSIQVNQVAGGPTIFVSLYSSMVNPADLSLGYVGDNGVSQDGTNFTFTNTGGGSDFFVVVNNVQPQNSGSITLVTGQVVVAAAPEPGTMALAVLGVGALALARRRRR